MVDISKIKPGDKITVELVVDEKYRHLGKIVAHSDPEKIKMLAHYIHPGAIVGHTPAPRVLKVGDTFPCEGSAVERVRDWTIKHIIDDKAWCSHPAYPDLIWKLSVIKERLK